MPLERPTARRSIMQQITTAHRLRQLHAPPPRSEWHCGDRSRAHRAVPGGERRPPYHSMAEWPTESPKPPTSSNVGASLIRSHRLGMRWRGAAIVAGLRSPLARRPNDLLTRARRQASRGVL